ncbi:RRQRL motif-containing zinc-binding protein [Salinispora arenicola]|uniref:RRQRL motif-containing zinc-binding protein n=1 Tax=Salinispora arenicola TaxID=168697 RepID=UPI00037331EF|nr:RRQRL motif-containing zinc-binding protein [Salinispora arenicola]
MSRIRAAFYDPEGNRYGIPTYWWRGAPAGYATRRQLRERGLCPGGQPIAAQILWRGVRAAYLYQLDLARPKRTASPAVLAALAKAMRARRTCPTCRTVRPYCIPLSLGECVDCAYPMEEAA